MVGCGSSKCHRYVLIAAIEAKETERKRKEKQKMKAKMGLHDALEALRIEERTRTGRKIHVKWTLAAEKAAIPGEYIVTYHYWWKFEK